VINSNVDRSVATALRAAIFPKQWSRVTRDSRGSGEEKKTQHLKSRARDYDHTHETALHVDSIGIWGYQKKKDS
jgi:hypothetical protein